MGHCIKHLSYHCSTSEIAILKDLNRFAFDPEETSHYHGNLTFHKDPVYKSEEEARAAIEKLDRGWYDDHAVRYRAGRKIFWLVKCEYHC